MGIRWPSGWDAVLEVKDEGRHYRGFGGNPTLSFKDRGMAMTVSMARSLGLTRLAVPTQGNAGDSLAEYAVAAGIEAVIAMSPDTDLPVLGKVAAYARLHPDRVKLDLVAGTIVDCARRIREEYLPRGYFSVATFQEPGWRTEGKKTLGLEMAEPAGDRLADRRWELPDVIVYPTGGGTGVVGMAKAFDELEALGLVGPDRPRMVCVQSAASTPIVRAIDSGAADIEPRPPGRTIATGLNVAQNIGHINVLRIIRETGGCALTISEEAIAAAIRDEWRERRFAWSPEGAATLAALPELADRGMIRAGDRVVLVNTASAEKYLPAIRDAARRRSLCLLATVRRTRHPDRSRIEPRRGTRSPNSDRLSRVSRSARPDPDRPRWKPGRPTSRGRRGPAGGRRGARTP